MSGAHGALRSGAVRPKERFTLKVDDRLDVGEPVEEARKAVRSRPLLRDIGGNFCVGPSLRPKKRSRLPISTDDPTEVPPNGSET